jgi:hypothetical protein
MMPPPEFVDVDPRTLHLPPSLFSGADPFKLHRQIAKFGDSMIGMPPPLVYRGTDGGLMIADGVTRATRVARLHPGDLIRVEVVGNWRGAVGGYPTIGDRIP